MVNYQTNTSQGGDVLMYHGPQDRGDINESGGIIEMTQAFETMAYLCLFGGNEEDDGSEATAKLQWCGNDGEPEELQYRGRLQSLLDGTPLNSSSVRTLEAAALEDLVPEFVPNYAASVSVSVSVRTPKHISIYITIELHNAEVVPITLEAAA